MNNSKTGATKHPTDLELARYLAGQLSGKIRKAVECHLGSCALCRVSAVAAYDSVKALNGGSTESTGGIMRFIERMRKLFNPYLALATVAFTFSFTTPRYFLQLLVATLLLGLKWVADSKSTRMLVMIHEAWKRDGSRGASDALERLETPHTDRLTRKL